MTEFLYSIDLAVFYFFNHSLSTPVLDKFFSIITSLNNWLITYVILLGLTWKYGGKRGKIAVVFTLIMIIITDQTGYRILKEYFARPRPCDFLTDVITPLGCTGTYSFPSNHALNNFAVATYFSFLFPKFRVVLFVIASLIAISRVYLGLHYPSDIIGGAIIGIIFGYIFSEIVLFIEAKFFSKNKEV